MPLPEGLARSIFTGMGEYGVITEVTTLVHHLALLRHITSSHPGSNVSTLARAMAPTPLYDAEPAGDLAEAFLAAFTAGRIRNLTGSEYSHGIPGLERQADGPQSREITHWYLVTDRLAGELDVEQQPLLSVPDFGDLWGRLDAVSGVAPDDDPAIVAVYRRLSAPE